MLLSADPHLRGKPATVEHNGFTLVEMLTVMAVIALMMGLAIPAMNIRGGRDLGANASKLGGILEQARTYAMAKSTYVYVCFLPGVDAELGKVKVVALASADGVGDWTDSALFNADLRSVSRPVIFENVVLDDVSASDLPGRSQAGQQLLLTATPSPAPSYNFPGNSSPTDFRYVLRFNSRGEAEVAATTGGSTPPRWALSPTTEIGLRAAHGSQKSMTQMAAIQVAGLTGQPRIFQP